MPNGPTRDPASPTRLLVEGAAILTPLGVIVAWLVTLLPIAIPAEVQNALTGLVVAVGGVIFSRNRDRQHATKLTSTGALVLLLLFAVSCVSYDGETYRQKADGELTAIATRSSLEPLLLARCQAHDDAVVALTIGEGESSPRLPFFAGSKVSDVARGHQELGAICRELVTREDARGIGADLRVRNRDGWAKAWRNGRALLGGAEESSR